MTLPEAQKFARKKILISTFIILLFLILLLFIAEVKGDFANGILFFMRAVANIYTLVFLIVLYGITYLFAGEAGKEIVFDKKNFVMVTIEYVLVITLILCITIEILAIVIQKSLPTLPIWDLIKSFLFPLFWKIAIFLAIAWFWATNKMKKLQPGENDFTDIDVPGLQEK